MEVQVRSYFNACKLALELVDWSSGEPESWGHLTVNLGIPMEKDCAFVDVNNFGTGILAWIEKTVWASLRGVSIAAGLWNTRNIVLTLAG